MTGRSTRDERFPEIGRAAIERDFTILDAFPRAVDAAEILGVKGDRLSKRLGDIAPWYDRVLYKRGRELRLPPDLVLDAARHFKLRSISEVAARLIDFAFENAAAHAELVDDVIERYFQPAERASAGVSTVAELLEAVRGEVPDAVHAHLAEVAAQLAKGRL